MTERRDDNAATGGRPTSTGRPLSTGEFRAVPDASANTAQFQAFAAHQAEPGKPWEMGAPGRNFAKLGLLIAAVVVVLVIIAFLVL
jgi:hypothetical protein